LTFSGFSAVYVDGVAKASGTYVPVSNRLMHLVAVYTTPHNAKMVLGPGTGTGKHNIRHFATYPSQLTAAQVLSLYRSYFGLPVLSGVDANAIVLSETAPAAKVYVKDWAHTGAG
jgi:hypothetical protein